MNKVLFFCSLVAVCFLQISCTKAIDEPVESVTENINGINVTWRSQITQIQKKAIIEVLNDLVKVEGATFAMGASPGTDGIARANEMPNAYVKLSDFYIGAHEISDEIFNAITGLNIWETTNYPSRIPLAKWELFISIIRDLTGLDFNFPSEAQWEYAAKGGKNSKGYVYPGSNDINDVRSMSFKTGSDIPNELGIYNLADLKSEWCLDMYGDFITDRLLINWVQSLGKYHVVRGGNYLCTSDDSSYYPNSNSTSTMVYYLGYGTTYAKRELNYRHCRITSRSYAYDNEIGYTEIGCRIVLN